jgi:protein O-GlcNAc transferase
MDKVICKYNNTLTDIYVYKGNEIISNKIRKTSNFYEIEFLDFIKNNFYEQSEIIDIGANIGNHSLFL